MSIIEKLAREESTTIPTTPLYQDGHRSVLTKRRGITQSLDSAKAKPSNHECTEQSPRICLRKKLSSFSLGVLPSRENDDRDF